MKLSGKQIIQMLETRVKENGKQKLLLHVCCGPCSSAVMELLKKYFDITLYYYNPNIYPETEYWKREEEIRKVLTGLTYTDIPLIVEEYDSKTYYDCIAGYEKDQEGGERCHICYRLRMEKAVQYAKDHNFDIFTTTLSISPYKNSDVLNNIGFELSERYGVEYLYSDFKKNNGYLRSCQITRDLNIYRQDYCGCVFSWNERRQQE